jgi:hypothetical protein
VLNRTENQGSGHEICSPKNFLARLKVTKPSAQKSSFLGRESNRGPPDTVQWWEMKMINYKYLETKGLNVMLSDV